MPLTLIKLRLFSNKLKQNHKHQIEIYQSQVPQILQIFKQKFLLGFGFLIYK